jgi:DNA-binding MarR family transcriptional regulator
MTARFTIPPSTPGPVTGQDINVAATLTRAVLDELLAAEGTMFGEWLVLTTLARRGGASGREQLAADVALGIDPGKPLADALDHLELRGLVRAGADEVALTADGTTEHARLRDGIAGLTAELYRDLDTADLVAAKRVLNTVTERAAARLAS